MFNEKVERIVAGLASQAAIAMDNARLFDKAKQAINIRDEFLSISSHELKTPLTPLKIQLQTILRHFDNGTIEQLPSERLHKMISSADKQVNRITMLVDDLLDVTRITSGKLTLNIEAVNLVDVVMEIIERYKLQLQSAKCELVIDMPNSLNAQVDRIRFEQVVVNLLTNAIKYAPGKPITITLKKNKAVIFTVSDLGIGISEEDQKRIFERFERANSDSAQAGLGLGLYIAKQIVAAHNGTIDITSEKGKGSTFIVRLPTDIS